MRIIHGGMARTLYTIPFYEFQLLLAPSIPHSAIAKTVLLRSLNFSCFYACGKSTFKTTIKTKTPHYYDNLTKHFSVAKL